MNGKTIGLILIVFLISLVFVSAVDFTPQGDINLRGIYQIKNATNITAEYYCNATNCYTLPELIAESTYYAEGIYINLNGTHYFSLNETKLNATIDNRDADTTYTNGTGLSLVGTAFSIVLSYFQGLFIELTDSFGGDVSGTYDEIVIIDSSHLHDAANITNDDWIEDSQEGDLNVNSSDYWGKYNIASDLNNLIVSHWDNITNKFITAVSDIYLYVSGTTIYLNETKLNATVDNKLIPYSTTAEIIAFGYYNGSDFIITDYFTKSDILGFNYYNASNFSIADYLTSAKIISFNYYNSSNFSISDYVTSLTLAGYNYYNASDFVITDYYTKTQIDNFNFYNLSDFDINDYYTKTQTDSTFLKLTGGQITGNLTVDGFIRSLTIDGTTGSGVIWAESLDKDSNVNVTFSGLDVTYPDMVTRLVKGLGVVTYCNITSDTVTIQNDIHYVFYVDDTCTVRNTTFSEYILTDLNPGGLIDLFTVFAAGGEVDVIKGTTVDFRERITSKESFVRLNHLRTVSGMNLNFNTVFPELYQNTGEYLYVRDVVSTTAQNSTTDGLHQVGHSGGNWVHVLQTKLNLTYCDDGTDFVVCPTNVFRRYLIYTIGYTDGTDTTEVHVLAPPTTSMTYANIGTCLDIVNSPITYSLQSSEQYVAVPTYMYCGKRDDAAWQNGWIDIRNGIMGGGAIPDTSNFLTKDTDFAGDVSGTYDATVVADSSHLHDCANITGATSDLCTLIDTDTNLTDADILAFGYNHTTDLTSYYNNKYADISVTGDNTSWNESLANILYRAEAWDNFTGIPVATPSDGDTTHLSTADQIFDYIAGLSYSTVAYVDDLIANIGNWSADKSTYQIWTATKAYIDSIGNWTADKGSYATTAYADSLGNWTNDKGDYSTSATILGYSYYNSSDFSIADYVTSAVLAGYGYYNSTDFSIGDYSTTAEADLLYAPIAITGTVTNIATGNGLTGGPITSTGTISTSAITVGAGNYSYWDGDSWESRADSDTTYSAGNGISLSTTTFSVAGNTALTQDADGLSVTNDGITDTQLAFNTGQHLTTTSDVTFQNITTNNLNSINCIYFDSGGRICSN